MTVEPRTGVGEARLLLQRHGVRHLPVMRNGRLLGVISDRDVRLDHATLDKLDDGRLVALIRASRSVGDTMSSDVHVISPDAPVTAAAQLMLSRRISALPVVNEECTLLGSSPRPTAWWGGCR